MKGFLTLLVLAAAIIAGFYFVPRWLEDSGAGPSNDIRIEDPATSAEVDRAAAVLRQARTAAARGDAARARALYEQAAAEFPNTWAGREANLELGNIYLKEGLKKEALEALMKGLPNVSDSQRPAILETIHGIERELAGKPAEPTPSDEHDTIHVVRRGDTLGGIARRYRLPVELVKLANNRTDDFLRIGDLVRISREMPAIRVSKANLKLELYYKQALFKSYPVGIGKDELTPAGKFTLGDKVKNPVWYRPGGGKPLPYGDPENILGTRWMTLIGEDESQRGYGIHGTTVPQSVPGRTSAGCIRMHNRDVEELYEWVPRDTKVLITDD
ncbi:MAG TPA: L,D-transpeptidase family protein [Planctomycetota bacterium]|nr:L,D-transpeptidase family protein [Planctomycetota bacterium]